MSRSVSEYLLRGLAIAGVVAAMLVQTAPGQFSAGSGNCTLATDANGNKCDGVNGKICNVGVDKCVSGTSLKECTDGGGNSVRCSSNSGCGGAQFYARTNASGC